MRRPDVGAETRPAVQGVRSVAQLSLPTVTLCASSSVNIDATLSALRASAAQVDFAECLFLTDAAEQPRPGIRNVPIRAIRSSQDYSNVILHDLVEHVRTDHCLIVQWDGFVLDAGRWSPEFLDYDYIGAPWPQFRDGQDVGNGGFSLRSRKLLEACRDPQFRDGHPEDVAICRDNRAFLETRHGIRFASRDVAADFAHERTPAKHRTFGFHGVFNMIEALGADRFWQIYATLDDRSTAFVDYRLLMRQLGSGPHSVRRRGALTAGWLASQVGRYGRQRK